jgi:hypothetical protein
MKRNHAMAIHKKGQAHWEGDLKRGKGTVSTESGALKNFLMASTPVSKAFRGLTRKS